MALSKMNASTQLEQLGAMLAHAIDAEESIPQGKPELIKVHAFINIANQLSLISSENLLQAKK